MITAPLLLAAPHPYLILALVFLMPAIVAGLMILVGRTARHVADAVAESLSQGLAGVQ